MGLKRILVRDGVTVKPGYDWTRDPGWVRVRTAILTALKDHEDARKAVLAKLGELDA